MTRRGNAEAWRERARQNAKAAGLLSARTPSLPLPAVSRLYYACFQAVMASLLDRDLMPDMASHGEVWRAAEALRPGLGRDLQDLHGWRRKADYATGVITTHAARELLGHHLGICTTLGIKVD